ncbi:MAG: protein kinase [Aquimonas sp.]|nr:protein kinase [Aquimonas sp.]
MIEVSGYHVSEQIGRGGMATVYRARQVLLDREVALKVLAPELARDSAQAARFLQEARVLAAMQHPAIVPVYDVGVTDAGLHYFSMQLLTGGDLAQRIRAGLPGESLYRIIRMLCAALGYAHSRGCVHRDVTPSNVLFDANERPVLTDFGIAKAAFGSAGLTAEGFSIGTSRYMSPEQARGMAVDARSDIYSFGVILYEILTGQPPFPGSDAFAVAYAHVNTPIPPLSEAQSRWRPVIEGCLAKTPEQRFPNCAELLRAIDLVIGKRPVEHTPIPPPARTVSGASAAQVMASLPTSSPPPSAVPMPTMPREAVEPTRVRPAISTTVTAPTRTQTPARSVRAQDAPSAPPFVGPLRAIPRSTLVAGLGLGLGLVAIISLAWWLGRQANGPTNDTPPTETALPAVAETSEEQASAQRRPPQTSLDRIGLAEAEARDDATPTEDAIEEVTESIALDSLPTVRDPVLDFLAMGRANLEAGRWLEPPQRNALDRWRTVFLIEADNASAIDGLRALADACAQKAEAEQMDSAAWLADLDCLRKVAASHPKLQDAAIRADDLLKQREAALIQQVEHAITQWNRADAEQALASLAAIGSQHPRLSALQKTARGLGEPGYAFHDKLNDGQAGPSLRVISAGLAISEREITVGEFTQFWRATDRARLAPPSCRDRESFFRSSKTRTWQAPGFAQDAEHPVVCVNVAMAEAYADWLSQQTGERYRLPARTELAGLLPKRAACNDNRRDAQAHRAWEAREAASCDDGAAWTRAAKAGTTGAHGLRGLDGNVREWLSDCANSQCSEHIALGASWYSGDDEPVSAGFAVDPGFNTIGIRLAREIRSAAR